MLAEKKGGYLSDNDLPRLGRYQRSEDTFLSRRARQKIIATRTNTRTPKVNMVMRIDFRRRRHLIEILEIVWENWYFFMQLSQDVKIWRKECEEVGASLDSEEIVVPEIHTRFGSSISINAINPFHVRGCEWDWEFEAE